MNDILYHYCSVETFLNIVKNNTIRLSDLNKMNDYSEMKATLDFLEERLNNILKAQLNDCEPIILGCENEAAVHIIVERILYKMRVFNDALVYAVCFSESRDLLSQWCRYADDGQGVAIGFSAERLQNIIDYENAKAGNKEERQFGFDKVSYVKSSEDLSEEFNEYAEEIAEYIIATINAKETNLLLDSSESLGGFLDLTRFVLLQKSVFLKIKDFTEENEVRIIFNDDLDKSEDCWTTLYKWNSCNPPRRLQKLFPQGLQFRATENNIISYLDMRFDLNCNEQENKEGEIDEEKIYHKDKSGIIKEVILGSNCRLTQSDIRQFLSHNGYEYANYDIEIIRSHATYRK